MTGRTKAVPFSDGYDNTVAKKVKVDRTEYRLLLLCAGLGTVAGVLRLLSWIL